MSLWAVVDWLGLWEAEDGGVGAAAYAIALPEAKPGAMGVDLIVAAIGGRKVARG